MQRRVSCLWNVEICSLEAVVSCFSQIPGPSVSHRALYCVAALFCTVASRAALQCCLLLLLHCHAMLRARGVPLDLCAADPQHCATQQADAAHTMALDLCRGPTTTTTSSTTTTAAGAAATVAVGGNCTVALASSSPCELLLFIALSFNFSPNLLQKISLDYQPCMIKA